MRSKLTKRQADALMQEVRSSLLNAEAKLIEYVQGRGWEAQGHACFTDAWTEHMDGVRVSGNAAKGVVIAALVESGCTPDEIALMVVGVGPVEARRAAENLGRGVPSDMTLVRAHARKRDRAEPRTVHVTLPPSTYDRYKRVARRSGATLEAEAEIALRLHFAELAARQRSVA